MFDFKTLNDSELLTRTQAIARYERRLLADFIEHLIEIDARKLYAARWPSMFAYLTSELRFSESGAGRRVAVARLCARVPVILDALRNGKLHLSAASTLASVITPDNAATIVDAADGRTKFEVEELKVKYMPRSTVTDGFRKAGMKSLLDGETHPIAPMELLAPIARSAIDSGTIARGSMAPAAEDLYNFRFAANKAFVDKLSRVTGLLSNKHPRLTYQAAFELGLDALLNQIDPLLQKDKRKSKPKAERPASRYIPAAVEQAVRRRDASQCTYIETSTGMRCNEKRFLQLDHVIPFAKGGISDGADNLRLLCATHNLHAARKAFGSGFVEKKIALSKGHSHRWE